MSKIISFRGKLADGLMERLNLKTLDGKRAYKINKFNIIGEQPGVQTVELVAQIYSRDPSFTEPGITNVVDFTNANLLAVAYYVDSSATSASQKETIIFDNEKTNQNMFVTAADVSGSTRSTNYYIELEVIKISDVEATMMTLKSLRTTASFS